MGADSVPKKLGSPEIKIPVIRVFATSTASNTYQTDLTIELNGDYKKFYVGSLSGIYTTFGLQLISETGTVLYRQTFGNAPAYNSGEVRDIVVDITGVKSLGITLFSTATHTGTNDYITAANIIIS